MEVKRHKYRIYPSLLDKFSSLLNVGKEFDSPYNRAVDEDGIEYYKKSYEEIQTDLENSLLDTINRKPHAPIEAADRGTAFNDIVDYLNHDGHCTGQTQINVLQESGIIQATINGFVFDFDLAFCQDAANYFVGCMSQCICSATIDTDYGDVELYGYLDELRTDVVYDIKTTTNYSFGKFADHWQKHVYPYCLIQSKMCTEISEFEYSVYVLNTYRNKPITGTMYRERYDYDHEYTTMVLRDILGQFIEWLELNRDKITNEKIFVE